MSEQYFLGCLAFKKILCFCLQSVSGLFLFQFSACGLMLMELMVTNIQNVLTRMFGFRQPLPLQSSPLKCSFSCKQRNATEVQGIPFYATFLFIQKRFYKLLEKRNSHLVVVQILF